MSKPTTSPRKSRSTAPAVDLETVKTNGTQDDAAVTTSAASGPSGLRAPDGINSTDTPPSSGDAAGDASADPVKPQVNSDHTETVLVSAESQTLMPEAEASASGIMSNASQGEEGGAGANAGSVGGEVAVALKVDDIGHLNETLALAAIGGKLLEVIVEVARKYPELQEWIGSDDPAGIVRELVEENAVLKDIRRASADTSRDLQNIAQIALSETLGEHADRYASMTREEFERDFPLSYALLSSFTEIRTMENPPLVRVTSERDGFRRAGIAHSSRPVDYRPWDISPEQLEAILAEPLLTVEVV